MTTEGGGEYYRIGDLVLDASSKTLYRSGQIIPMAYRSAQLLAELARNHPNVVRRIDLIETLWPREDVTDQALSQRVSILRKELGDTAGKPRYVGRVWGWGYHLVAPVERLPADARVPEADPPSDLAPSATPQAAPVAARAPDGPLLRLAVLGFRNESSDAGTNWLATGLTEAVCADLSRRGRVAVVARQLVSSLLPSVPDDRSTPEEMAAAASLLGVRWLVAGAYTRAGAGLRIAPLVFDAESGRLYREEALEGSWQDLFALQDEVVDTLADWLHITLANPSPAAGGHTLESVQAFEEYATGRKLFFTKGKAGLEEARQHFQRAITLSPGYAMAHSGLGSTLAMRFIHRADADELDRAASHLRKALEVDPEITEPYPWLCYCLMRQGRFDESIATGRRGVELQPDYAYAPYFLGLANLVHAERMPACYTEAVRHLNRAVEVEPRLAPAWHCLTHAALLNGDCDQADACCRKAIELERTGTHLSQWAGAGMFGGQILIRQGRPGDAARAFEEAAAVLEQGDHAYREAMLGLCACGAGQAALRLDDAPAALPHFRKAWQLTSQFPLMLGAQRVRLLAAAGLASAYAFTGQAEKASQLAREATSGLQAIGPESWLGGAGKPQIAYQAALGWLRIGNGPAATACLEAAVSSGWRDVGWLEKDPELAGLRRLSGFVSILSRASKPLPPASPSAANT